jgi:ABC-type spermidine/putrescine transport system permease subunit I
MIPLSARSPAAFADRRRAFYGALLLAPPLLWLGIVYLGSLFTLLMQSFYAIDEFTARVVPEFTLETYRQLVSQPANVDILVRTLLMAVAVTIAAGIVAFPIANFMARHAGPRMKAFFYVGVMLPMWTSYLVKVYAWRLILAKQGIASWALAAVGLDGALDRLLGIPVIGGPSLASSYVGMFIVFVYMWLPFMILPLAAALERVPVSLVQAAADLGATPRQTVPAHRRAARVAGPRGRLDLHVRADARRLHHPQRRRRSGLLHRHDGLSAAGHGRQPAARGRVLDRADRADRPVPRTGQAARSVRCALTQTGPARRPCRSSRPRPGSRSCTSRCS